MWVDIKNTGKSYCPDVCKVTEKYFRPEFQVPYAVPSSLHTHPKVNKLYYVCAGNPVGKGWGIGFNIENVKHECHVAFLYRSGPKIMSLRHYHCLCSDEPVEPIKKR